MVPSVDSQTWAFSRSHSHLNEKERGSHKERATTQPQIYTVNIFSNFLQKPLRAFTSVSLYWGKGNYHTFQELLSIVSELTLISRDWKWRCGPQLEGGLMKVKWCTGFSSSPSHSGFSVWLYPVVIPPAPELIAQVQTSPETGEVSTLLSFLMA